MLSTEVTHIVLGIPGLKRGGERVVRHADHASSDHNEQVRSVRRHRPRVGGVAIERGRLVEEASVAMRAPKQTSLAREYTKARGLLHGVCLCPHKLVALTPAPTISPVRLLSRASTLGRVRFACTRP